MRPNVARSLVALVAVLCAATLPRAAPAAGTGLSAAQARTLHALGYAVVPNPLPPGFRVASVSTTPDGSSYRVVYVRNSDGATFTIAGRRGAAEAASGVAAASPEPKKRGGFLASVSPSGRLLIPWDVTPGDCASFFSRQPRWCRASRRFLAPDYVLWPRA